MPSRIPISLRSRPGSRRARLLEAGLGLLLLTTACGGGATLDVPVYVSGRTPYVEAWIAERGPYPLALDPSEPGVALDSTVAAELGLGTSPGPGSPAATTTLRLGAAALGPLAVRLDDFDWASPGGQPLAGSLGFAAFPDRLVTTDLPHGRLQVRQGSLPEPDGRTVLQYTLDEEGPAFPVQLAGRTFTLHLSPGSLGKVSLPAAEAKELPWLEEPGRLGYIRHDGREGALYGARVEGALKIGAHVLERPSVYFSAAFQHGAIGHEALLPFRITFDTGHQRVRFEADGTYAEVLERRAAALRQLSGTGADLRAQFNHDRDKARLITILSPT